ncbi:MAG: UDP-glucose 4-epimerase GalE [Lachnospiraceae bacterium]|nr:UDP-glucose 4-epimerase GalE [Lachnospiraceae bacterium]
MERIVLLAGGAGYIGSHTAVELVKKGYQVVIADCHYNSSPLVYKRLKQITGRDICHYNVDVCDEEALEQVFEENQIDVVINFAGYKAVGESVRKPMKYYRNNLNSTFALLSQMKKHGVDRIIFSSSATVYGMNNPSPLTEENPLGPCTNPYGWTKFMNEQILRDTAQTWDTMSVVLLRYFNPAGAHESGLIGEDPKDIPNNLMPYISQVACGRLKELSVFGDDYDTHDGTGVRDYIHVVDLAKAHVCATDYSLNHSGVEAFNIGTGTGYSVLDMVKAFEKVNGVPVPYQITPRRPGDVAVCYADSSKAQQILGWKAQKNLEDMCRDSWNWQSQNPNGYDSGA